MGGGLLVRVDSFDSRLNAKLASLKPLCDIDWHKTERSCSLYYQIDSSGMRREVFNVSSNTVKSCNKPSFNVG